MEVTNDYSIILSRFICGWCCNRNVDYENIYLTNKIKYGIIENVNIIHEPMLEIAMR